MALPLIPWECHVFPPQIQAELRRRAVNRGLNPISVGSATWDEDTDDWETYRGPMTSWVRACSNGSGFQEKNKKGFVFYGGKDFYSGYGFNRGVFGGNSGEINQSVIGYTPDGKVHIIENSLEENHPIHVPPPEIDKISAVIQKELLRRVSLEWTCFSFNQLEYMTPYFLTPGISCVVEWGWNHFNPLSLLDLDDTKKLKAYFNNPYPLYEQNVLQSRGNYEVLIGIVTNFDWSIEGNKIRCKTEVTSKDRLWAGQMVTANMLRNIETNKAEEGSKKEPVAIDNLQKFVVNYIDKFTDLISQGDKKDGDTLINEMMKVADGVEDPTAPITFPLRGFLEYMKKTHPNDYKTYLFGIFFGRDEKALSTTITTRIQPGSFGQVGPFIGTSTKSSFRPTTKKIETKITKDDEDFDVKSPRRHKWMNMGLVVEIINYFSSRIMCMDNLPLFRVNVDDCVIAGHPNMISTDGNILLIPNALAPKYFFGSFGDLTLSKKTTSEDYKKKLGVSDNTYPVKSYDAIKTEREKNPSAPPDLQLANYQVYRVCLPIRATNADAGTGRPVNRDDLSSVINMYRTSPRIDPSPNDRFEFPFSAEYYDDIDGVKRTYQPFFTGLFKNLYLNFDAFKSIVEDSKVVTYEHVYQKLFVDINSAAGNFWDLELVGSTGRSNTQNEKEGLATMKIVDNKLAQYTSNQDVQPFMFGYYASEGLLQNVSFRPQLSNAQAIRTIYAQNTANKDKKVVLSDRNQLLDYKFKDRLMEDSDATSNTETNSTFNDGSFRASMARLQGISPPDGSFPMTLDGKNGPMHVRLALPSGNSEMLTMLLDDTDENYNPSYSGIMPGIQAEFSIQGLAGLRTFGMFRVRGLPAPYSEENVIFRIINVKDSVQNGQWQTTIVAGLIPLRGYFKSRLGLPLGLPTADDKKT